MVHWWVLVHCGLMPAATGITGFRPNLALPHMGPYSSTAHSLGYKIGYTGLCIYYAMGLVHPGGRDSVAAMGLVHPGGRDSVAAMGSTRACSKE
jgi:hypothetical protein